ncbi:MAG TPA: 50S ribosomal protein L25/general stress protein Ctc [Tenuifilaceae bacterium]|nr:50S ribosomal protein L25/general stress protein Ctc [Tenuifilaceae bacterium]HPE19091.1 50S ribosomal protein L25/general stress protein Ctc [Tenuifilaceae bacterium]HPJ46600.1 50S ribosomal protein L25/general stress protein Ctc [Tenuifilaceae bacterium]HPQ34964.1 50S ribosomal protein L25/general stress protein Ctc [Tenuifilaceae bacterium]
MKSFEINGSLRTEKGKKFTKKMRKQESVPAILYGGKENVMLSLDESELRDLIYTPNVYIVDLKVGKKAYKSIIKDIQFHPVNDRILHIDFLELSDDKKVTIGVPVELTGSSEGVKQGGKLTLITRKLKVSAFPKDLPDTIKVDITNLDLGKSKLVGDISLDNIQVVDPKSTVIATVKLTRAARGAAQAAEGEAATA